MAGFLDINKIRKEDKELDRYKRERELVLEYDNLGETKDGSRIITRKQVRTTDSTSSGETNKTTSTNSDRTDS